MDLELKVDEDDIGFFRKRKKKEKKKLQKIRQREKRLIKRVPRSNSPNISLVRPEMDTEPISKLEKLLTKREGNQPEFDELRKIKLTYQVHTKCRACLCKPGEKLSLLSLIHI